ncbi:MAG: hypothetical protein V7459_15310 [Oceanicoccus sp.]
MILKIIRLLDWRLFLAMSLTTFWLGFGLFYLGAIIGWDQFFSQPLESLGSFLEGAFAPLAFLWLVVGYFLQQKELSKNTAVIQKQHAEMQKSADNAALQATSIQASALHTQQTTFLSIYEMVRGSMGATLGMLFISSQGSDGTGLVDSDGMAELWAEQVRGDPEVFTRRFLFMNAAGEQDMMDLFYGTEIRTIHTRNFMRQYDRIVNAAKACDPDLMIADAITATGHGLLYRVMIVYTERLNTGKS